MPLTQVAVAIPAATSAAVTAATTSTTIPEPQPLLLAAAAFVLGLTLAGLTFHALRTRPRRPPESLPTMVLRAEPPAVVDLLTDDFVVTPEAVPATLLDLAARGLLRIEEPVPDRPIVRLRRPTPTPTPASSFPPGVALAATDIGDENDDETRGSLAARGGLAAEPGDAFAAAAVDAVRAARARPLAACEQRVLRHVEGLAIEGVVPSEALTTGPQDASEGWWDGFRREVVADAQERGLCLRRWPRSVVASLSGGPLVTGGLLWAASELGDETTYEGWMPPLGGVVFVLLALVAVLTFVVLIRLGSGLAQRDTDAGLVAASHWLGVRRWLDEQGDFAQVPAAAVTLWGPYLAHAVALDLAPLATAQLPLGAEDDRETWSRAGGRWRRVRVLYPRLRPAWGMSPAASVLRGLLVGAPAALLARLAFGAAADPIDPSLPSEANDWFTRLLVALGVLLALVTLFAVVTLALGAADIGGRRVVTGVVLRRRPGRPERALPHAGWSIAQAFGRRSPRYSSRPLLLYLAVDEGVGDRCTAWLVHPAVAEGIRQGETVRARVTRQLHHVKSIERLDVVTGEPRAPATPPGPPSAA